MSENKAYQDDFEFHAPGIPGSSSSKTVFDAYLQTKIALARVPKASRGENYEAAVHTLLREKLRADATSSKLFRKNSSADELLSQFWLARVSEAAKFMEAWRQPPKFKSIDKGFLNHFARLSVDPENIKTVEERLAEFGIVVVHERAIPGMKVDGACFLLSSGRPVIALSLRYARLDIYWFVLMHELSHIVAHYEKLAEPILDDFDHDNGNDIEIEANLLAANSLIPRYLWRSANVHYNSSEKEVLELARKAETHPSIVAGRLQKETGKHYIFANFVNAINSRELIFGYE
jgi:HTH-type transcriptional regulator / antitoxin HigA